MEKEPVLVLVTMQHACARLIREGVDLALREGRPVKVLHVVNPTRHRSESPPSTRRRWITCMRCRVRRARKCAC